MKIQEIENTRKKCIKLIKSALTEIRMVGVFEYWQKYHIYTSIQLLESNISMRNSPGMWLRSCKVAINNALIPFGDYVEDSRKDKKINDLQYIDFNMKIFSLEHKML